MAEGIRASLAEVAGWIGAELIGANDEFCGVSTDSRSIEAGMLFVALRGPRHDGHQHVVAAQQGGAVAAMVERRLPLAIPQLVVADTRQALAMLAAAWRQRLGVAVVAVTGSNGKTTVKEMCAAILSQAGPTLATRGNLNNEIGVPLTLLRLEPYHRYAVIEIGANHPGEIAMLVQLVAPQVALITNAGPAHLEGFGSLEGVAYAKGEIYGGLGADGVAIVNADDVFAPLWLQLAAPRRILRFGVDNEAEVRGQAEALAQGQRVTWQGLDGECVFTLALPGEHNLRNALAASAAALALGLDATTIAAGLQALQPVVGRLNYLCGRGGAVIIDDSYNANPASLRAGLEVLAARDGERYLVLGEMGELGADAEALHREAGRLAGELGIDRLYACGALCRGACEAFGEQAYYFDEQQPLIEALMSTLNAGITVLVKGSRSSRMERVVLALVENEGNETCCMP